MITPVVGEATPLELAGSVAATPGVTITDIQVRVGLGAAVTSRSGLTKLLDDPAPNGAPDYPTHLATIDFPRGASLSGPVPVPFSIEPVDLRRLGLPPDRLGVYPLRIGVNGTVGGVRTTVAATHTFLVWAPSGARAEPTPLAVVLPLADRRPLRPDGILADNTLARSVEPGGRLYRLLEAALPPPGAPPPTVALAVDPVLVEALARMAAGPYEYATPAGPAQAAKDTNAQMFLDNLRDFAAAGGTVFALPYGDVDVTAFVHADILHPTLLARLEGREVVKRALGFSPDATIAYPAGGLADAATVDVLARQGVHTVVVDDRLLPADPGATSTPPAGVDVPTSGGVARVLAADHQLADAVTSLPPTADAEAATTAFQAVLANLAMITAEAPSVGRMQVLALPRYWDPPAGWASAVLPPLTANTSFHRPVALAGHAGAASAGHAGAASAGPARPARFVPPGPDWAQPELPSSYVKGVEALRVMVWDLAAVRCGRRAAHPDPDSDRCWEAAIDATQKALFRVGSVAWRDDHAAGELMAQQVLADLNAFREGIRVVASRTVTLTSHSGRVPVTLENNTSTTVTVVLDLSSTDRARLRSATKVERTVPARQKVQVEIDVLAESAGTIPVDIRLLTPDGRPLSGEKPVRVLVRSSAYGVIATMITSVAAGVLLLAVSIRLLRRLRRRPERHADRGTSPGGASPGTSPGGGAPTGGADGDGGTVAEQALSSRWSPL
jgi:hypothetical protein